jgi:prepilin-type N-terminal cleavage/methylation domain-containing protein
MLLKYKNKRGFTLVEMIVSLSIVTVIMLTVLFNYSSFNDRLALSSAAEELAIAIRQAQTYGLTVKEVAAGGGRFDSAYGIYFDSRSGSNRYRDYYLFADLDGDGKYTVGSGCGSGSTECIEKVTMRNNIHVSSISVPVQVPAVINTQTGANCSTSNQTIGVVTFLRPNPDANISFYNSSWVLSNGPCAKGSIVLVSPKGKTISIIIENTGQIYVGAISG